MKNYVFAVAMMISMTASASSQATLECSSAPQITLGQDESVPRWEHIEGRIDSAYRWYKVFLEEGKTYRFDFPRGDRHEIILCNNCESSPGYAVFPRDGIPIATGSTYTATATGIFYVMLYFCGYHDATIFRVSEDVPLIVTFNTQGGSAIASQSINYGATASLPATPPVRTGYTFGGWYTNAACTNIYDFDRLIREDITLYAKWTIIQYSVTFNTQGSGAIASQSVNYGTAAVSPAAPVRTAYTFGGWYTDAACTNVWNFANAVTANITLYAKWTIIQYSVTFNVQGGSAIASQSINYGATASLPATPPVRTGYIFGGWYADAACANVWNFANAVTTNLILYAKWTIIQYTVTFMKYPTWDYGSTTQSVEYGAMAVPPAAPVRTGYTFGGWYSEITYTSAYDVEYITAWDFDTAVMAALTLYAKWDAIEYTVTFDTRGGSAIEQQVLTYHPVIDSAPYASPPVTPVRIGYTFGGWYADETYTTAWNFGTAVTADLTLYAKWTILQYAVIFNTQGGSAIATQNIDYGTTAVSPAAPVRTGYTFDGWYADETYTTAWDFGTAVTADLTLYAKWTIIQYAVTFNTQGGSSVATQNIDYGTTAVPPAAPARTGYAFGGWYEEAECITLWNFNNVITGDLALFAKWIWTPFTITFDSQGGSATAPQDIAERAVIVRPADPVRTGYTFDGWYADDRYTTAWDFDNAVTASFTLYAKWTPIPYEVTFNTQGGTSVNAQSVDYGTAAVRPANPEREGYAFGGWYTNAACTNAWNFDNAVTGALTLYAKWAVNVYLVIFEYRNGTSFGTLSVNAGEVVVQPADPTREGYEFGGWYTDVACINAWNFDNVVTGNLDLYAKWTAIFQESGLAIAPASVPLTTYPNPSPTGEIQIENPTVGSVEIHDMEGNLVASFSIGEGAAVVNISHLPAGTYFVTNGGKTSKVIKQY